MSESVTIAQILNEAFKEGGWGMWWVLILGLVALGLVFERVFVLLRAGANRRRLMQRVRWLVARGDLVGALRVCACSRRPAARVIGAGLLLSGRGRAVVQHAVEAALARERHQLERRTDHLTVLASVTTAAGVLGTVTGAVKSTTCMCYCEMLLLAGMSEALNCAAFGLLVGILCLVARSLLEGKTQALLDDLAAAAAEATALAARSWSR